MFSIFKHVMKSERNTNSEPGLPVVLHPDIKAVALKIAVSRSTRHGATSFARDKFITTLLIGCFIACFKNASLISREEAVTHAVLPFPDTKDLMPPGKYSV